MSHDHEEELKRAVARTEQARRIAAIEWDILDGILHAGSGIATKPLHRLLLLAHIRLQGSDTCICYASNTTLAEWIGCTPDNVRKIVKELVEEGVLEVVGKHDVHHTRATRIAPHVIRSAQIHRETNRAKVAQKRTFNLNDPSGGLPPADGLPPAGELGGGQPAGWEGGSRRAGTPPAGGMPNPESRSRESIQREIQRDNLTQLTGGALAPRASDPSPQGGMLPRAEGEELFLKEVPPARDRQPTEHYGNAQVDDISTIQITERQFPDSGKVTVDLRHGTPLMQHVMGHLASQGEAAPAAQALGRIKQRLREIYLTGGVDLVRTYVERAIANAKRPGEDWQASMCASQRLLWELKTANTAKATNTSQSRRLKGAY